jgi:hypothetical protein
LLCSDTLKTVADWVDKNRTDPKGTFALLTNFPKKTFSGDSLNTTLLEAGTVSYLAYVQTVLINVCRLELVPRGVLVVTKM